MSLSAQRITLYKFIINVYDRQPNTVFVRRSAPNLFTSGDVISVLVCKSSIAFYRVLQYKHFDVHRESKKTRHLTLAHNFTKYWPIFKILSLLDSVGNLLCTNTHHTLNVSLQYLVKYLCSKMAILKE